MHRTRTLSIYPILTVSLSMVAFIIIKTGRDAVFFQEDGLYRLPAAYLWITLAASFAAVIHLKAIDRWGARRSRVGLFFLCALMFFGFVPLLHLEIPLFTTALFVITPTIFAAIFAGGWLLAGDLLEDAPQDVVRYTYSYIGAGSMIGGIVGGTCARVLSAWLSPGLLIACGAGVLAAAGLLVCRAHSKASVPDPPPEPVNAPEPAGAGSLAGLLKANSSLLKQPYILAMIGISSLSAFTAMFIDFQFYATVSVTGNNSAAFFANFYIILNAASLVLQLFIAPRLQSKLGVGGVLMLLPTAVLGSVGLVAWWTTVQAQATLRIMEGGVKAAFHRSIWEQTYLRIDQTKREITKVIVDGFFARMSEGIGAGILFLWLSSVTIPLSIDDLMWIPWVLLVCLLIWLSITRYLQTLGCSSIDPVDPVIRLPDT